MFVYPSLTAVPVKGIRVYETPQGQFYPSITTVLGTTMSEEKTQALKKWQLALGALADKKTKEAADHGTMVHLLIERFLKGEELFAKNENIDSTALAAFNALKLKLKNIKEIWGQEVALYSDLLEIAGRCDCVGVYKDKPSIIDFKTSGKIKTDAQIDDYKLQLTAYAIMHNEMFGTDITDGVVLMTSSGGFPQEFHVDLSYHIDDLIQRVNNFYINFSF